MSETNDYGIHPAGRLPAATRHGEVRLQVADLARSLAYYHDVLGLRIIEHSDRTATLGAHGDDAVLIELRERAGARSVPQRGRLGLYHFAILLPDRAALGRFVAHLAESGARAGAADHLVSEALYLRDPDGLGIEVYADRPRSLWRTEASGGARQLVMATEPLDLEAVARAAGGEPWTGMPAGTTMGHVHLHVGDIERASAFYHRALGLDKVVWSYPGALFLSAGGYHHHLGVNTWAGPGADAPADDEARLLEWTMLLPAGEADAAVARLAAEGSVVRAEAAGHLVADPWGTVLRIREAA
jgi:catechol 2,3-dioxygenase